MNRVAASTFATLIILAGLAAPAVACTQIVPAREGETPEEASQRASLGWQNRQMREAANVFIADVVELTRDGNRFEAVIIPKAALKGALPSRSIRYTISQVGVSCGSWDFPGLIGPIVFYADSPTSVRGALDVSHLEDVDLQRRAFAAWDQIKAPPRRPRSFSLAWPWAVAGALISLGMGYWLGRVQWLGISKTKIL